jgi:AraC-like DNA-binding protein
MGTFHGTWLRTVETDDFLFTWTRFESAGTLSPHAHDRPYASVVVHGSYTELHDLSPRWCTPGTAIVHEAGEVHADHFHDPCIVLNAESRRGDVAGDVIAAGLLQFAPVFSIVASKDRNGLDDLPVWLRETCAFLTGESRATPGRAAALAGKHPADFSRAFRKYVGLTPGEFQRGARIRRAVELMMTSPTKLAQVAQECGFSDQSHFTHAFVREAGMPPRSFAAAFAR